MPLTTSTLFALQLDSRFVESAPFPDRACSAHLSSRPYCLAPPRFRLYWHCLSYTSILSRLHSFIHSYMAFLRQPTAALGMCFEVAALLSTLLLLSHAVLFSHAADPDPMQDFCVADFGSETNVPRMNGYACKTRALVTSKDFLFTGLRSPGDVSVTGTNATVTYALVQQFPGVNTQQISHVRLDFAPGGVLPPHTHPLATETIYVVEGTLYTGFISHDNKLYAETLQKGDVYIFPRATLHFQINVGDTPAVSFNSFNAQFPGLLLTANQLFETNIDPAVLMKAFGTDEATVKSLTASVPRFWG